MSLGQSMRWTRRTNPAGPAGTQPLPGSCRRFPTTNERRSQEQPRHRPTRLLRPREQPLSQGTARLEMSSVCVTSACLEGSIGARSWRLTSPFTVRYRGSKEMHHHHPSPKRNRFSNKIYRAWKGLLALGFRGGRPCACGGTTLLLLLPPG